MVPTPKHDSRSALIVRSTSRSRSMPPGCGRVVITQRSIRLTTSSAADPRPTRRSSSSFSAPTTSVSTTTLPRKRRRSHEPIEPVPSTDTRVRPESWNVSAGPSHSIQGEPGSDRKSTRLNSSHQIISYAVFCLKKKKKKTDNKNIANYKKNDKQRKR